MICPACPAIAMAGGGIAAYFGIDRPDLRTKVTLITSAMLGITTVALKLIFDIRLCDGNGNFSLRNIGQVGAISLVLGLVYSVAVSYLLNRFVRQPEQVQPKPACCHHKDQ